MNNTDINYYDNYQIKQKLRSDNILFINNLVSSSKYALAVTLTFNGEANISINQAKKQGIYFKNLLDKDLYGKSHGRFKGRTPGCLIVEGNDYNDGTTRTHLHGILGFNLDSIELCKSTVKNHWRKIKRSGIVNDITEWDGNELLISYLLKQHTKDQNYSDAIIWQTMNGPH